MGIMYIMEQVTKSRRGPNKTFYHFKVFNKETGEMKRFFTAKDISLEYGISIPCIFKTLKVGLPHNAVKFNHLVMAREKYRVEPPH